MNINSISKENYKKILQNIISTPFKIYNVNLIFAIFLDQNNQAKIYNANFSQQRRDSDREREKDLVLNSRAATLYILLNKNILNMLVSLMPFFSVSAAAACSVLILKTCIRKNTTKINPGAPAFTLSILFYHFMIQH